MKMINYLHSRVHRALMWLTTRLPVRQIDVDGRPYMQRYHLAKVGPLELRLHRFISGDGEQWHDHPFSAACLILCGSYVEERVTASVLDMFKVCEKKYCPFTVNVLSSNWWGSRGTIHRIASAKPNTWSLNVTWRTGSLWGFYRHYEAFGMTYKRAPESNLAWYRTAGNRASLGV